MPEYTIHDSLTLPIATNAQEEIVGAALSILRAKYPKPMADSRPDCPDMSFHFKKAGVILWQISPDHPRQQDLFDSIDRSKQKKLMEAIDAINRKNGYGTIRQAIQGTDCRFDLKREYMSKQFTTNNKMNKNSDNKIKLTFHPAEFGTKMPIPLAEQSVKAGFPSPAQDYMEGEIDLNDILVRHREATFYVRISGDSMQDAGILDGDLAVVDRQIEPSNGNFVIAFVDGEFTIKQFKMDESGTFGWLIPWNKNFSPIRVDETNRFMIWGVVTYVIHQIAE